MLVLTAFCSVLLFQACKVHYQGPGRGGGWHRKPPHHRPAPPHRGPGRGPRRGGHHNMVRENAVELNEVTLLSLNYSIKEEAAAKIINFASGNDRETSLNAMGVSLEEMTPLANLEMPTRESVAKIAAALDESDAKVERILSDFIADMKAENSAN